MFGKSLHRDNGTKEQPAEALEIAGRSDVIIAALGESAEMEKVAVELLLKSTSPKELCK
jgi:hypothetical protein